MDQLFVETFLDAYPSPPVEIILDVDATDDPTHGDQEGRFFEVVEGRSRPRRLPALVLRLVSLLRAGTMCRST